MKKGIAVILILSTFLVVLAVPVSAATEYNVSMDQIYNLCYYTNVCLIDGSSEYPLYAGNVTIGSIDGTGKTTYGNYIKDWNLVAADGTFGCSIYPYLPYGGVIEFCIPYQYNIIEVEYLSSLGSYTSDLPQLIYYDGYEYFEATITNGSISYSPDVKAYSITIPESVDQIKFTFEGSANSSFDFMISYLGITAFTNPVNTDEGAALDDLSMYLDLIHSYLTGTLDADMDVILSRLGSIQTYLLQIYNRTGNIMDDVDALKSYLIDENLDYGELLGAILYFAIGSYNLEVDGQTIYDYFPHLESFPDSGTAEDQYIWYYNSASELKFWSYLCFMDAFDIKISFISMLCYNQFPDIIYSIIDAYAGIGARLVIDDYEIPEEDKDVVAEYEDKEQAALDNFSFSDFQEATNIGQYVLMMDSGEITDMKNIYAAIVDSNFGKSFIMVPLGFTLIALVLGSFVRSAGSMSRHDISNKSDKSGFNARSGKGS